MTPTDRILLQEILTEHEGLRLKVYADTVGKKTIGVGRNLTDVGISHAEAIVLLENDIDACLSDLQTFPWFHRLNTARQIAVIDWRFNLGPAGFRKFGASISFLEDDDYIGFGVWFRRNKTYFAQVGRRAEWIARVIEAGVL